MKCVARGNGVSRLILATHDGPVRVLDYREGELSLTAQYKLQKDATHVALMFDGDLAVASDANGKLTPIRLSDKQVLPALTGHEVSIQQLASNNDGLLASGDAAGKIILWQFDRTGQAQQLLNLPPRHGAIKSLTLAEDSSKLLVLVDGEYAVRLIHLDRLQDELKKLELAW